MISKGIMLNKLVIDPLYLVSLVQIIKNTYSGRGLPGFTSNKEIKQETRILDDSSKA